MRGSIAAASLNCLEGWMHFLYQKVDLLLNDISQDWAFR